MILSYGHSDQNIYLSCQKDLTKLLVSAGAIRHGWYIYKIQHTRHINVVSRMVIEMLEPDSAPAAAGRRGAESE